MKCRIPGDGVYADLQRRAAVLGWQIFWNAQGRVWRLVLEKGDEFTARSLVTIRKFIEREERT